MSSDSIPAGYNTPAPLKILTPDRVDSRLGALEFSDGVPTEETADRLFDNLDHMRAVEVFLNCIPAASMEAMRLGYAGVGADACHKMLIMDGLLDSDAFFLTGNTDTVYCGTSGTRETLAIEMGDVSLTALGFGEVMDTRPSTEPTHRRRSNPSRFAPSTSSRTRSSASNADVDSVAKASGRSTTEVARCVR